jgi:hypothetical protein
MSGGMSRIEGRALADAELDGVTGGPSSLQSIGAAVVQAAQSVGGGLGLGSFPIDGKQIRRFVDKQMNGLNPE